MGWAIVSETREPDDGSGAPATASEPTMDEATGERPVRVDGLESFELKLSPEAVGAELFKTPAQKESERATQVIDEVAEDMLELMKRATALDAKVDALAAGLARLQQTVSDAARMQGHEIDKLKETLISDRKELIGRSTFNALTPAIESFQYLREAYQKLAEDHGAVRQTATMLDLLNGIVQMLGYQPFTATPGEAFDPHRMECAGYGEGEPGRVISVERPGYKAGGLLVRPCAVVIGKDNPKRGDAPAKS